jgi:regulator of RNase E activity RraA
MFVLKDLPPSLDAGLLDKLRQCETATIGHFMLAGFMDARIQPIQTGSRIAGTAITVRTHGTDSTIISHALSQARPGDVLVIDRSGEARHASWGLVTSVAAKVAGLAGVIIDGRACDLGDIRAVGLPLWCIGPSPILTRPLAMAGDFNIPVNCGGVVVNPGDAILADDSGVLVLAPREIAAVADHALELQAKEVGILERVRAGTKLTEISGATKAIMAAMAKQPKA